MASAYHITIYTDSERTEQGEYRLAVGDYLSFNERTQ